MLGNGFSIRHALSFGWNKSIEHIVLLLKMAVAMVAVEMVLLLGFLPILFMLYVTRENYLSLIPITILIAYCISAFLLIIGMVRLGVLRVLLDLYNSNHSSVKRMFSAFHVTLSYVGAALLFNCMFIPLGSLLGMLNQQNPGIGSQILAVTSMIGLLALKARLGFYMYAIVDRKLSSVKSLKRSWEITKGSVIKIMLFEFVLALIPAVICTIAAFNLMGVIGALSRHWYGAALFPSLLFTLALFFLALVIPMIMLANVYVYKQLSAKARHEHDVHENLYEHN